MSATPERVVYRVTITQPPSPGAASSSVQTTQIIDGVVRHNIVPSTPPLVVMYDKDGRTLSIIAMSPGMELRCEVMETLPTLDLETPGTLIHHDFSKVH